MKGEIFVNLDLQISHEIGISPGYRIVSVNPVQPLWESIERHCEASPERALRSSSQLSFQ